MTPLTPVSPLSRQHHAARRAILMKLFNRLPPAYGYDLKDTYNRQLAARRTRRQAAWLAVILALVLVVISFGMLVDTLCSPLFSTIAVNILIAGIWGGYHLITHH